MNKTFFQKNRMKVFDVLEDNSFALFHSGYEQFKTADAVFPFVVNNNFYYLTGLKQANLILIIARNNNQYDEYLFIDENDERLAKWVGWQYTKEEAANISFIPLSKISYHDAFDNFMLNHFQTLRYSSNVIKHLYLDLERRDIPLYQTFAHHYASKIKEEHPAVIIKNSYADLVKLRMIKEDYEVNLIKESIETTKMAIENVMKHSALIKNEADAESYHNFILTKNKKKISFDSIIASGKNATILHYTDNQADIVQNDLLLMDVGCYTNQYSSDITRTFPLNGKFSKRQKEVYQAVLDVNKKCIAYAKNGISWQELNDYAKSLLSNACISLGLIKDATELGKYYYHSIGHSLGLDVHDPSIMSEGLQTGMVITIEPGLYLEEEGIGIRIEDNILILDHQAVNLSQGIIKEIDEIEAFMKK